MFQSSQGDTAPRSAHHVKAHEFDLIVSRMIHRTKGIQVQTTKHKSRAHYRSFTGENLVDWLYKQIPLHSRQDAVVLGQRLANCGLIVCLSANTVDDDNHVYRFLEHQESPYLNFSKVVKVQSQPAVDLSAALLSNLLRLHEKASSSTLGPSELRKFQIDCCELQTVRITDLDHTSKLAFFLNLSNLLTIHSHIVYGPPSSLDDAIERNKTAKYFISGCSYDLNEIKHGLLRGNSNLSSSRKLFGHKVFKKNDPRYGFCIKTDPRIHFALCDDTHDSPVCRVFTKYNIQSSLHIATFEYLVERVHFDVENNLIILPKVFERYSDDFGGSPMRILSWIRQYLDDERSQQLEKLVDLTGDSKKIQRSDCSISYVSKGHHWYHKHEIAPPQVLGHPQTPVVPSSLTFNRPVPKAIFERRNSSKTIIDASTPVHESAYSFLKRAQNSKIALGTFFAESDIRILHLLRATGTRPIAERFGDHQVTTQPFGAHIFSDEAQKLSRERKKFFEQLVNRRKLFFEKLARKYPRNKPIILLSTFYQTPDKLVLFNPNDGFLPSVVVEKGSSEELAPISGHLPQFLLECCFASRCILEQALSSSAAKARTSLSKGTIHIMKPRSMEKAEFESWIKSFLQLRDLLSIDRLGILFFQPLTLPQYPNITILLAVRQFSSPISLHSSPKVPFFWVPINNLSHVTEWKTLCHHNETAFEILSPKALINGSTTPRKSSKLSKKRSLFSSSISRLRKTDVEDSSPRDLNSLLSLPNLNGSHSASSTPQPVSPSQSGLLQLPGGRSVSSLASDSESDFDPISESDNDPLSSSSSGNIPIISVEDETPDHVVSDVSPISPRFQKNIRFSFDRKRKKSSKSRLVANHGQIHAKTPEPRSSRTRRFMRTLSRKSIGSRVSAHANDMNSSGTMGRVNLNPVANRFATITISSVDNLMNPTGSRSSSAMSSNPKISVSVDPGLDFQPKSISIHRIFSATRGSFAPLPKGFYVGYLNISLKVSGLHVMVPIDRPSMVPVAMISQTLPSQEDWFWLQGYYLRKQRDLPLDSVHKFADGSKTNLPPAFKRGLDKLASHLSLPDVGTFYDSEILSLSEDNQVQVVLFVNFQTSAKLPPIDTTQFMWLTREYFAILHHAVYTPVRFFGYRTLAEQFACGRSPSSNSSNNNSPGSSGGLTSSQSSLAHRVLNKSFSGMKSLENLNGHFLHSSFDPRRWLSRICKWASNGCVSIHQKSIDENPNTHLLPVDQLVAKSRIDPTTSHRNYLLQLLTFGLPSALSMYREDPDKLITVSEPLIPIEQLPTLSVMLSESQNSDSSTTPRPKSSKYHNGHPNRKSIHSHLSSDSLDSTERFLHNEMDILDNMEIPDIGGMGLDFGTSESLNEALHSTSFDSVAPMSPSLNSKLERPRSIDGMNPFEGINGTPHKMSVSSTDPSRPGSYITAIGADNSSYSSNRKSVLSQTSFPAFNNIEVDEIAPLSPSQSSNNKVNPTSIDFNSDDVLLPDGALDEDFTNLEDLLHNGVELNFDISNPPTIPNSTPPPEQVESSSTPTKMSASSSSNSLHKSPSMNYNSIFASAGNVLVKNDQLNTSLPFLSRKAAQIYPPCPYAPEDGYFSVDSNLDRIDYWSIGEFFLSSPSIIDYSSISELVKDASLDVETPGSLRLSTTFS